jgi:hypothetical protein
MEASNIKYSPLRGVYVDSKGRIATEKKKVNMPSLKKLDIISSVILFVFGCFAVSFVMEHNFYYNTSTGNYLIAVTPKTVKTFTFETVAVDKATVK